MEVTHHTHGTHAVVGGVEMEDFSIANTAQFFTVLSKTLYTNEILAVVREIICNAWDAHIAAGRTDKPIEITINETELVIRDYGNGIPHNKMHQTYFVYGLSDKLDDITQTGGFGLGSKAPFAYTDHFTVVSMNQGTKTVYDLSKASGEKGGKPRPRIIVQLPTDESGLIVKVPIQDKNDVRTFIDYARSIVSMGEINATLNDAQLKTFPISTALKGIYFFKPASYFKENLFYIRVGTVVYPIDDHDTYATEYTCLKNLFKDILGRWNGSAMLLQAPPGRISVAPNRESLSMSKTTQETIRDLLMDVILFTDFNRNAELRAAVLKHLEDAVAAVPAKEMRDRLTRQNPTQFLQNYINSLKLMEGNTFDQVVHLFIKSPSPFIVQFIAKEYWRLLRLSFDYEFMKYFPENLEKHKPYDDSFARRIYHRAARAGLNCKKLFKLKSSGSVNDRMVSLTEINSTVLSDFQEIIKMKVVCFHNKLAALRYHRLHPYDHHTMGYVTNGTKEDMDRALAFFTKMGWEPLDFTAEYNGHYKTGTSTPRVKKPKIDPRLLPMMSNLLRKNHVNRRGHIDSDQIEMGTEYPAVVMLNDTGKKNNFPSTVVDWVTWQESDQLIAAFGTQVAIAPTVVKYKAMLAAGKISGEIYMGEIICRMAQAIPDYMSKLALMKFGKTHKYYQENMKAKRFLKVMHLMPQAIIKDIPTAEKLTEDEHKWLGLYVQMMDRFNSLGDFRGKAGYDQLKQDKDTYEKLESTPTVDVVKELFKRPSLKYLALDTILSDLETLDRTSPTSVKRQIFIETLLLLALTD
jgi:hypothetical protein